ncbi:unnamed protein product [Camellia sinensis]
MKQYNFIASIKELPTHIKREIRESNFRIAATIILCISMSIFIFILSVFVNHRVRKFLVSDELYFPPITPTLSHSSSCNCSSSSSTKNGGLREWIAPSEMWHSMTDKELLWRASMVPSIAEFPYNRTPKVAFMFLTRGRLPLAPFWEMFFKDHEGFFSIYLHTSPEFTEEAPESSVFYKRRIPSKPVQWGRATMIDAERRLLANALLDFSNERFILLSETCIPLFNFTTTYTYLFNSNHSYLSSFDDPRRRGRGRYNKRMWPAISLSDWRKGSQWFEVHRKLAIQVISDVTYYPVFKDHCKPPCYMDEHYLPTLVTKVCPELTSNRTITWVDWSGGGSHPTRFVRKDVTEGFLNQSVVVGFNGAMHCKVSLQLYSKSGIHVLDEGEIAIGTTLGDVFKDHEGFFSIYLHSSPEFTEEAPESLVFYKQRIPSKPVQWGRATMIDAERNLLANALIDFANERFILLSETCIPLFNFTTTYTYLLNSNHSFLRFFDDPRRMGRGRYNKRMWPAISLSDWRKGSQWFEVWASMVPSIAKFPYNRTPKVAFMFLTRGRLPLAPLWEIFFKDHERFFYIYLRTSPEFTEEAPESSVFYKQRIPSKPVQWGRATMIDAERSLLANALIDFANERFILLSETCIPLFNFTTTYTYLLNSNHSFLRSFDDPRRMGRGRYNKRMWLAISLSDWRKGSQWFEGH